MKQNEKDFMRKYAKKFMQNLRKRKQNGCIIGPVFASLRIEPKTFFCETGAPYSDERNENSECHNQIL
jgi:hypothetical protein